MIQRIQTLWLLIVFVACILSFFMPFAYSAENNKLIGLTAQTHWYLFVMTILVGLGSLISIFLYHDRKLQVKITLSTLLFQLILLGIYITKTMNFPKVGPSLFCILVAGMPVFFILAIRAIKKDMKLVEDTDRLR